MVLCAYLIKSEGAEMASVSVWTHLKTAGQGRLDKNSKILAVAVMEGGNQQTS